MSKRRNVRVFFPILVFLSVILCVSCNQGAGTVDGSTAFTVQTKTVANDASTLGLTATTATSSVASVATAAVDNGIVITSVSAGSATVTCSDGTNSATIAVTVAADGSITYTVSKYSATPTPTPATTFTVQTKTVTNDASTLGLTATTATSSAASVATAAVNNGIVITSVSAGSATVTCSDGIHSTTIAVTVATDGSITYTVSKIYSFSALSSADLNTIASVTSLDVSTSTDTTFTNTVTLSSGVILYQIAASKFKLRSAADGNSTSLYFNTGITAATLPSKVSISDASAYIKVPNTAAGSYTIYGQISGSVTAKSTQQLTAVLCDQDGNILDSETATVVNSTNTGIALTATVSSSVTAVYIIDYRTEAKGGLDIRSVSFTPAN
jgi:hypothetical protein